MRRWNGSLWMLVLGTCWVRSPGDQVFGRFLAVKSICPSLYYMIVFSKIPNTV